MRHGLGTKKIGRLKGQTETLARSLVRSFFLKGHIKTTLAKAKLMKPVAERMITLARKDDLSSYRRLLVLLRDSDFVQTFKKDVTQRCGQRPGGYLRITKCEPRKGDCAQQALVTFVDAP